MEEELLPLIERMSARALAKLQARPPHHRSPGGRTRRVRFVRGEGRGVSGSYGGRDAACPVRTGGRGGEGVGSGGRREPPRPLPQEKAQAKGAELPPSPRIKRTRRVPHPVLIGRAAPLGRRRRRPRAPRCRARCPGRCCRGWSSTRPTQPCGSRAPGGRAMRSRRTYVLTGHASFRTDWTRLVPPPVLTGHVSSLLPY